MDVVITATLRPEILDLTLSSFQKRLFSRISNARLIINIDPVGDTAYCSDDVLAVCYRHFSRVVYRSPDQASFSAAVKWGWEQVETEYFLHLEDDWLLKKQVNPDVAFLAFEADPNLASMRLNLTSNPRHDLVSDGFSLNPSVMRRAFIQEALPFFNLTLDPEKQFRQMEGSKLASLAHWRYRLYGTPSETAYVIDIGKKWRRFSQFDKWNGNSETVTWKESPTTSVIAKIWNALKYRTFLLYWKIIA